MYQRQQQHTVRKALQLFTKTQVAFARCEANGIKVDVPYLESAIANTQQTIADLARRIFDSDVGKVWREIYGEEAALTVRQQLGTVLFKNIKNPHPKNLGYVCTELTRTGLPRISEGSLEHLPGLESFAADYARWMSLNKMLSTNLHGIKSCIDHKGFIHPSFSLFSVVSYRTASAGPNFQNFPNHGAMAGIVRRCFIPRSPDRHLAELDYSGAEVRVNASINNDPVLVGSVTKGIDFHKAVAAKAYMLPETEVNKALRQSVKGPFTFAAFYGSYWAGIAEGLWNVVQYGNLQLNDGTPLKDHIRNQGITSLGDVSNPIPGTFYEHIKRIESWFWNEQFKVYGEWKEKAWRDYLRNGYVDLPSGFRCAGIFGKNAITNYPAQGSAAHCLLWSFCKLDQTLQEMGFRTLICGQIHDSILLDIPHNELDDVLRIANDIMTKQLVQEYTWIKVPMEVEADVAPMGKSWWDKAPYEIPK